MPTHSHTPNALHPLSPPHLAAFGTSAQPVRGSALGIHAKFQATRNRAGFRPVSAEKPDATTGEIKRPTDPIQNRLERFALQSVVRSILPKSRTANCLRLKQKNATGVDVYRSIAHQRAHYGGLQTCASVWCCPVCAAKISERRRQELHDLIEAHHEAGGVVLFLTKTAPHKRTDDLGQLLDQFAQADASLKAHRDYKSLMKSLGSVGTVRTMEVTFSEANGFHPHIHELLFVFRPAEGWPGGTTGQAELSGIEDELYRLWSGAAVRAGFNAPSRAHGLSLQNGDHAAKYASKWGLESEMTQWHRKRGKVSSLTPFDLLRWFLADGSARAAQLFRIYAENFHGRHQLQYSRGLKKLYSVGEATDEELAAAKDDDAQLLGSLSVAQWRLVVGHGQRGALLEVASVRAWEGVLQMLAGLAKQECPDDE